jgi:hypothetical protein
MTYKKTTARKQQLQYHDYTLLLIHHDDYETIYEHYLKLDQRAIPAEWESSSISNAFPHSMLQVRDKLKRLELSTQYLFEHDMITTIPETGQLTITDYGLEHLKL